MIAGIAVALAAAAANAAAVALQAVEARATPKREALHASLLARLAARPRWLAGVALMAASWPLQTVALALAPITVVQPTLATSQLMLLVLAAVTLHERVGRREIAAAVTIVAGISGVIAAAPARRIVHPASGRLVPPLVIVGAAALLALGGGRRWRAGGLPAVVAAGLAFAWSDFATKLLADNASAGAAIAAAAWAAGSAISGVLAVLAENTALQQRPSVRVAPVIASIKIPLPVLVAIWVGLEHWGPGAGTIAGLLAALGATTVGAAALGRSPAVTAASSRG